MNGSVHKIPDRPKPWRARYRGPDGVEHSKTYRRKVDAERWLRGELGKTDRGAWIDPSAGEVDFADWSAGWLRGLILKPKTRDGYESLLRSRILPRFGPVPIARITPGEVRAWITDMTDEGLSAARIRQARQVLHAALEQAVTDGLLARNPTAQVKPPKEFRRRQLFLTAGELAALSGACEDHQEHMGALVLLLGWSGLRWGESVALRWSAVNPDRRRVRVKASATEVAGHLDWGTPKTHEARTVIVPRFVIDRLGPKGEPDELVFTAPKGGPLRTTNFRRDVWAPATDSAGMPKGFLVHDLRDTAATLMISAGASIKAVQRALGHASAAMTLDTYGSLFEDDLEDLADRLETKFASVAAQTGHKQADIVHLPR